MTLGDWIILEDGKMVGDRRHQPRPGDGARDRYLSNPEARHAVYQAALDYVFGGGTMSDPLRSGRVDTSDPNANMYGCQPCPKCGSIYRIPTNPPKDAQHYGTINCEGCGFEEPITEVVTA
jgi:predicted RNA-binding Zn-ribbon protein involved in translation (DUF1610 family)